MAKASDSLSGVHVLKGLDAKSINALSKKCVFRDLKNGEIIIKKGEVSADVFFVISGQVAAFNYVDIAAQVFLTEYFPGDLFGELAAIEDGVRAAWIVAAEDSRVAVLSGEAFMDAIVGHKEVTRNILAHFARLVRGTGARVRNLSLLTSRQRIAIELLRLAGAASRITGKAAIEHMPSHSALASYSSTSREIVGDAIGEFMRDSLISRKGQSIVIDDIGRFRRMIDQMDYRKLDSEEGVQSLFKEIYAS